ncbi:MAG: ATP-binding protein, partial [Thermodesulfobacteriota bacterium]
MLRASPPSTVDIRADLTAGNSTVLADPTQVQQIIMNLCTNAYQAMSDKGGVLTVGLFEVPREENLSAAAPGLRAGATLCLRVSDTGTGIEPAIMDRIFDPYFTTKGLSEGTGLGLSVVHGIVENHGGVILADSQPGRGTTFDVYLPLIQAFPMETP